MQDLELSRRPWAMTFKAVRCVDMGLVFDVSDTTDSVLIIRVFISGASCYRPSSKTCGLLSHLPLMMEMLIVSETSYIISTTQAHGGLPLGLLPSVTDKGGTFPSL